MKFYEACFGDTLFAFRFLFSLVRHAGCYYFHLDLHAGKFGTQAPGDLAKQRQTERKPSEIRMVLDVGVSS